MSFKEIVSEGEDFVVEHKSRKFGSATATEALKVDGRTGVVTIGGRPVVTGSGGAGKTYLQRAVRGSASAGGSVFSGALAGDVVVSISSVNILNVPVLQDNTQDGLFELVISIDGQIQQLSGADLSDTGFLILLERS